MTRPFHQGCRSTGIDRLLSGELVKCGLNGGGLVVRLECKIGQRGRNLGQIGPFQDHGQSGIAHYNPASEAVRIAAGKPFGPSVAEVAGQVHGPDQSFIHQA